MLLVVLAFGLIESVRDDTTCMCLSGARPLTVADLFITMVLMFEV